MNVLSSTLRLVAVVFPLAVLSANSSAQETAAALFMIADFADRLCGGDIPLHGNQNQLELSGEVKLELSGLVKKLANLGLGFEGGAKYTTSEYEKLLRKDLAELLRDKAKCKSQVERDLAAKLVVSIVPKPESPYQTAARIVDAWHAAIMAQQVAEIRDLTVLPLAFKKDELQSVREVAVAYVGGLREMLGTPNGRARIHFGEPMTILELFADWNFSTDNAMMRRMKVQRQDIAVPVTVSDGGEGTMMIIVRPGVRYLVVRVF